MAERSTFFAQQEIRTLLEPVKGELIYIAKKDLQQRGPRSARRFKKALASDPQALTA